MIARKVIIRLILIILAVFASMTIAFYSYSFFMDNIFYDQFTVDEYFTVGLRAYIEFIKTAVIGGDWGFTIHQEITSEIMVPKFIVSLKYIGLAIVIFIPLGITIGVILAFFRGTIIDKIFTNISLIVGHIPVYLFFVYCILFFGYVWHILPLSWPFVELGFATPLEGTIIPVMTLVSYPAAILAINLRAELIESFEQEYFTLARAKGLTKMQVIVRHSLRPSMVSIMPIVTNLMIFIISMSFLVEILYFIPGIGQVFFDNLIQIDPDLGISFLFVNIQSIILITTFYMLIGLVFVAISDAIVYFLDPRIRQTIREESIRR